MYKASLIIGRSHLVLEAVGQKFLSTRQMTSLLGFLFLLRLQAKPLES